MARKDLTKGRVRSATKGINGNKGLHKKVEYGKQKTESYELKTIRCTVCTYDLICFFFADVLSPWHDLPSDMRHKPQIHSSSTFGLFGTRDLVSAFIYSSFSGSRASYPCLPPILLFISSSRPKMQSLAKATVSKRRVAVSLLLKYCITLSIGLSFGGVSNSGGDSLSGDKKVTGSPAELVSSLDP